MRGNEDEIGIVALIKPPRSPENHDFRSIWSAVTMKGLLAGFVWGEYEKHKKILKNNKNIRKIKD